MVHFENSGCTILDINKLCKIIKKVKIKNKIEVFHLHLIINTDFESSKN